jgi:2-oxoglutarate ferredoxin oxidoreductase subunit beta
MYDIKVYEIGADKSTWCPGCGDFGILNAIKQALAQLELAPHQVMFFSGIGCGSKLPHYLKANGFNSIHGRALPVATGFRLSNTDLVCIAVTGDGDGYGIGAGHFMHTARRNVDVVHIVENNQVYGLTKGQYSPTSDKGFISTTTPEGAIEMAVNPIALAIAAGATFVARGFSSDTKHLAGLIVKAIQHRGYALIDVLQPCVTYNHVNTNQWYKMKVYKLDNDPSYDPHNKAMAFAKAQEWGESIPLGIIYIEERDTYEDQVTVLAEGPLYKQPLRKPTFAADFEAVKRSFM